MTRVLRVSEESFEKVDALVKQGLSQAEALDRLLGEKQPADKETSRQLTLDESIKQASKTRLTSTLKASILASRLGSPLLCEAYRLLRKI